ncbi:DUF2225 domain-containing protein [Marinoscillum sp.]|uniref:tetratricopeptide repeat-containing hybrid sensor histidine kinase/response regulator n=1 Tax=Marinoscillum sp. TaxID=2024838 RepID=UPI003BAD0BA3
MYQTNVNDAQKVTRLLAEAYDVRVSDLSRSVLLTQEALEISQRLDEAILIARSLSRLSLFHMILGEYKKTMKLGKKALGYFQILGDEKGIADVKYNIAGVYYRTDNYHLALIYLIDCFEIYQKLDDFHNQSRVQKSLGTIYEYFGDQKSAILSYEKAIKAAQMAGDLNLESNAYNPLSGIYLNRGEIDKADEMIERSIRMKNETGDIRGLAFGLYGRAKVFVKRKAFQQAEETFMEAVRIHVEMGERLGRGMCYYKLGQLYREIGDLEKSDKMLDEALDFAQEYNMVIIKINCNYLKYELCRQKGDAVEALKYLEIYLKEKEAVINTQTQKVIESYEAVSKMERLQKEAQMNREKAEILKKKNRAEEASRVKQEFLSTMSHEIRTPLNAVITITSLLEERSDKEENELLRSLKFSANNLLRIINDILDFSKLDAGRVVLETQPVEISQLMGNIRNAYLGMAREKGIDLKLTMDSALAEVYLADETKISQILGNLISNAIKYTDEGHVNVEVKLLDQGESRDQLEFRVEDTGGGIPENFLEEIFESFSQPRSYTTKKQGGSGLGLAIVKKLIGLHGSNIHVKTQENKGSVFYFQVSFVKGKMNGAPASQESDGLRGRTVLIAEDNMINAMVALKLLGNWGVKATHARDGSEAIQMSSLHKYDYILMDIHMPEVDGFDAARTIRESENPNTGTPIFALTADITAHQREIFEPYFDGFLLKPIEREKLYRALSTH